MQNSEFEKNVQQKVAEFKIPPSNPVWQKIEAGLPQKKKSRSLIIIILLFVLFSMITLVLRNQFGTVSKRISKNIPGEKAPVPKNTLTQNTKIPDQSVIENSDSINKVSVTKITDDHTKRKKSILTAAAFKIKILNGTTGDWDNMDTEDSLINRYKDLKTSAAIKINIKAPIPVSDPDEGYNKNTITPEEAEKTNMVITDDTAISITGNLIEKNNKTAIDSIPLAYEDTTGTNTATKPENKEKKQACDYGIYSGAGISAVMNNHNSGTAYNLGLYVRKNINSRLSFSAGLNYLYQSNKIKVGNRIDSVTSLGYLLKDLNVNNYYLPGNSVLYKNKSHLLEIPLLFQYWLSKRSLAYFESGATATYLIYSNAIVYNNNLSIYFTDKKIFNRFLLSFNLGTGINLAQNSKLSFSIGCRVKYDIGSIIKAPFGKQHSLNALLYLKIPLKR